MTSGTVEGGPAPVGPGALSGDSEEVRARRRAVSSLLGIAQRMTWLTASEFGREKILAEMGGMSAWVSAFTCSLAGLPIELSVMPEGELMLASIEVLPHTEKLVDATAVLPSEGAYASGKVTDAASRRAAIALSLVELAAAVLEAGVPAEGDEIVVRHRTAELRLFDRLQEAARLYFERDLDPNTYVPEISAHGMPEDG